MLVGMLLKNKKQTSWIKQIIINEQGTPCIVTHGKIYNTNNLPSFITRYNNDNMGLIPHHINNDGIVNVLDDVNLVNLIFNQEQNTSNY